MAQTVIVVVSAIKTAVLGLGTGVLMGLQNVIKMIENFINTAIDMANGIAKIFGIEKTFDKVNISIDALNKGVQTMKDKTAEAGKATADAFWAVGEGAFDAKKNTDDLAKAQTLLKGGAGEASDEINNLVNGLKDNSKATKEAEEEAKKLEDRWKKLKDETIDLKDKGTGALKDLANENVKDLEKIDDKVKELRKSLADLKTEYDKDVNSEDRNIAERIIRWFSAVIFYP